MKIKVLLISEDQKQISRLSKNLPKIGIDILLHQNGDVLQAIYEEVPHLILVDEAFDDGKGRMLATSLKQDVVLKYIPLIFLVDQKQPLSVKEAKMLDEVFQKNGSSTELKLAIEHVIQKNTNELDVNPLTHMPGTRSSVLKIEQAFKSSKKFSVLCIDLSQLAVFNKAYGDARGDEVIIRTSEMLKKALRLYGEAHDFIGHSGGDDFIVLTTPERAVPIAEAFIQNFDSEIAGFYDSEDRERRFLAQRDASGTIKHFPLMSVSVSIIENKSLAIKEASEISRIAGDLEKSMHQMPNSCYAIYHPPKKNLLATATNTSQEIHFPGIVKSVSIPGSTASPDQYAAFFFTILKEKKIQTLYQPIVDMKQRSVVGYEALSRPVIYYPSNEATTLFSVARQTNHVKELDLLCVEFALQRAQTLSQEAKLFLNLNHETLMDASQMRDIFAEKGAIGFKNIVIEITEQSILRSFDKVRVALAELKEQGVSVAIDDVGGGAVSLRDVALLKPDFIKFDRSLMRQIDVSTTKQQILMSLIVFAKGIGALTVGEGIETKEECEAAQMCGISLGQGYYFARPQESFQTLIEPWSKG